MHNQFNQHTVFFSNTKALPFLSLLFTHALSLLPSGTAMNCTLKKRRRLSWTFTTSPVRSETTNRSDQRSTTLSRRPSTKTALSSASTIPRARRWSPPFRPTSPPPSPTCELRFWRGGRGGGGAEGGGRLLSTSPGPWTWRSPRPYQMEPPHGLSTSYWVCLVI